MPNTFISKVKAERRILAVVNAHFQHDRQLAGLSNLAIDRWKQVVGQDASADIVMKLKELAEVCQSLSDRSHESLRPLNPAVNNKLEIEITALESLVCNNSQA